MVKKAYNDQNGGKLAKNAPDHLGRLGKSMWRRIVPLLEGNSNVRRIDANLVELYCSQYEIYRTALKEIQENGITIRIEKTVISPTGKIGGKDVISYRRNPATAVLTDATSQLTKIGAELGLSPKSRAALLESQPEPVKNTNTAVSEMRKLFGGKTGKGAKEGVG